MLIDFTRPEGTLEHIAFCVAHNKKMVIGTTGFDDAGKAAIQAASEKIAIVFASNFSVGVNLVFKLLEKAAKVMGDYCDIESLRHITATKWMHHLVPHFQWANTLRKPLVVI